MKLVSSLLLALLLSHASHLQAQTTLKFCFEDVPQSPWTMPDGTGLNIELLRRVEELLGERFELIAKPWKRCQEEVRTGVIDGYFGAGLSEDRRKFSVYPSLSDGTTDSEAALNTDQTRVFTRSQSAITWDGKSLQHVKQAIVVQRGYLVGSILEKKGYTIREVKTLEDALRLLASGEAEVAILQGMEAIHLSKQDARFKDSVVSHSLPYLNLQLYLAISQHTFKRDPKRFQSIWNGIKTIRNTASYQQLVETTTIRE